MKRLSLPLAAALLASSPGAFPQNAPDFGKVEIKVTTLADDFHVLEGQGGAISVLSGPDGVLLVDSQFAPLTERLVAAIRGFSDKPIRFLVDTHLHGDHTGGNENFARLGATIFSRDQLRARLEHPVPAADGTPGKPAAAQALPVVTYDAPVTIHLDGEHVLLWPVERAHTDGDTIVSFPAHDVLAVGDVYRSVGWPIADLANGGSLPGLLEALAEIVDRAGPATRIVPGHGPIVDRAAVTAQRDLLVAVRARVVALVAQGKSLDEVVAAKPTADLDARVPQGAQTADRFVKWLYAQVKADR